MNETLNFRGRRGAPINFEDGLQSKGVDLLEYLYRLSVSAANVETQLLVVAREYTTTAAGIGYVANDRLVGLTAYDTSTSPAGESTQWFNVTTKKMISAPAEAHLVQTGRQTTTNPVAPRVGYVCEDEYIAQNNGSGYLRGDTLRRYDLVSQDNGLVVESSTWYNRSTQPVSVLNTPPAAADLGRDRQWVLGEVSDPAASSDGVGDLSVIGGLRALILGVAAQQKTLSELMTRISQDNQASLTKLGDLISKLPPALGGSDDSKAMPVRITTMPALGTSDGSGTVSGGGGGVSTTRYRVTQNGTDYQEGDVLCCIRWVSGGGVSETWLNEVTRVTLTSVPPMNALDLLEANARMARLGTMELSEGQSFTVANLQATDGRTVTGVSVVGSEGRSMIILSDNSNFFLERGETFEFSNPHGNAIEEALSVSCISGYVKIIYSYHS